MNGTELSVLPLDIEIETRHDPRWLRTFPGILARGTFVSSLLFRSCLCPGAWSGEDAHDPECPVEPLLGRTTTGGRRYAIGPAAAGEDGLRFRIFLYGVAARSYEAVIDAVSSLTRFGVGSVREPARRVRVWRGDVVVYDSDQGELHYPGLPDPLPAPWRSCSIEPVPADGLRLRMATPLDLGWKRRRAPEDALSVAGLGRAVVRRWKALSEPPVFPDREVETWLTALERADLRLENGRWVDAARWSSRQRRWIPMGGLLGTIILTGDEHHVSGLADTLSLLPVGSRTTFGHGMIVRG